MAYFHNRIRNMNRIRNVLLRLFIELIKALDHMAIRRIEIAAIHMLRCYASIVGAQLNEDNRYGEWQQLAPDASTFGSY